MRLGGIEPPHPPWEGGVIPLDQSRFKMLMVITIFTGTCCLKGTDNISIRFYKFLYIIIYFGFNEKSLRRKNKKADCS